MRMETMRLLALAGLTMYAGAALAQQQTPPASPAPAAAGPAAPWAPVWSDDEIRAMGETLSGSWRTTAGVAQTGGESGARTDIHMHIAPVVIEGMPNALYVEAARADSPHRPYRQAIFQFYRFKDGVRLRTLEFHKSPGIGPAAVALWAAPELFPKVKPTDLIATLDLAVTKEGDGYKGATPYPYPTAAGNAVEMTSSLTFGPKTLVSADRGFGADGKVVWGSSEAESYTFEKFDAGVKWTKSDDGLAWVDLRGVQAGDARVESGDNVTVHYSGWLYANGTPFDSSRDRGQPFPVRIGGVIEGWNKGMLGAGVGTIRRLVIPPSMAYGDKGAGRVIPPNATLTFEVEVLDIQKPPKEEAQPATPEVTPAPASTPPAGAQPAASPK